MDEISELKQQGLSVRAIARLTGYDRKPIRRYLVQPSSRPVYKTLIHIQQSAPVVEHRPLAAYETMACGGAQ